MAFLKHLRHASPRGGFLFGITCKSHKENLQIDLDHN